MARTVRKSGVKELPLSEINDDLSRYLRGAETQEIIITCHGQPAGVLIGFEEEPPRRSPALPRTLTELDDNGCRWSISGEGRRNGAQAATSPVRVLDPATLKVIAEIELPSPGQYGLDAVVAVGHDSSISLKQRSVT
jgi:prevent-host-death family protein